jgi:glycine cleavage system H protein
MSDMLVFMMGKFESRYPTDRQYAKNHMWAQSEGDVFRFGFTAYAVRLMQDVYFLDWIFEAGETVKQRQEIGSIESKKAESDLFAPIEGTLRRMNDAVLADPSLINTDNYGKGWLFEIRGSDPQLLSPEQYIQHLDAVWEVTQRMLKTQLDS